MSMILDALTRAEHERQLEKQPGLKFVTPVKQQKKDPKKIWAWVGLAVLANALVLFFAIQMVATTSEIVQPTIIEAPVMSQRNSQEIYQETRPLVKEQTQEIISVDATPLKIEVGSVTVPEVDRPLIYESKQKNNNPKASKLKPVIGSKTFSKGNVAFSSTELSVDYAAPVINKPKLLINGVDNSGSLSSVPNLSDLPENSRNSLSQYEVNVHVFDDDPIRRFVLINMNKYKEGDRIANNGPLIEEITPEGVVVNLGSGRALLPHK